MCGFIFGSSFGSSLRRLTAGLAACFTAAPALASPLAFTAETPEPAAVGAEGEIRLVLSLEEPWYIYAPTGLNAAQGMIETAVEMTPSDHVQFAAAVFPAPRDLGGFSVLAGDEIVVIQPFRVRPRTEPGEYRVRGAIDYQTCDDEICLPPDRVEFTVTIRVQPADN